MKPARFPALVTGAVALTGSGMFGQSLRQLLHHIDRHPGLCLSRAGGVGLAALVAYQCVNLYSVIVTPLDSAPEQAARRQQLQPLTILSSFDPFFTAAAAPIPAADLTLHGLRQDRQAGGGSAIISQAGGAQRSLGIGEEIAPGLVLKQVGPDHAIVIRNGVDERLALKPFEWAGSAGISAGGIKPRAPAPRGPAPPGSSINFADPSTLPASLTGAPAILDSPSIPKP